MKAIHGFFFRPDRAVRRVRQFVLLIQLLLFAGLQLLLGLETDAARHAAVVGADVEDDPSYDITKTGTSDAMRDVADHAFGDG